MVLEKRAFNHTFIRIYLLDSKVLDFIRKLKIILKILKYYSNYRNYIKVPSLPE